MQRSAGAFEICCGRNHADADCAGANHEAESKADKYHANAWLVSEVAARELALSLGVKSEIGDYIEDFRYRIAKKLAENAGGAT